MEVVVTTEAIRCAKLESKCHNKQTNTQFFIGYGRHVAQPTVTGALNGIKMYFNYKLQTIGCFDTVGWVTGRASSL